MSETKTRIRFFTIADYEEEEIWLRRQHSSGWKLIRTVLPCFYVFERCAPEDVVYRLDYKNSTETGDYLQLYRDYGWECCERMSGWLYFRKPASACETEAEGEIFSDNATRVELISRIVKTRMLPLLALFFCCVLPGCLNSMSGRMPRAGLFTGIFTALLLVYLYLIVHCGLKLRRLRRKYGGS